MPTINANDLRKWKTYLDDNGDRAVDNVFDGLSFIQGHMASVRNEIETLKRNIELLHKEFAETGTEIARLPKTVEPALLESELANLNHQLTYKKSLRASLETQRDSGWSSNWLLTMQINILNSEISDMYRRIGHAEIQLAAAKRTVELLAASEAEIRVLSILAELSDVLEHRFSDVSQKISKLHTTLQTQT